VLALAPACRARAEEHGWRSSGGYLVELAGAAGAPGADTGTLGAAMAGSGFAVEPLLEVPGEGGGSFGPAAAGGGRTWLLVRPPAAFAAAAAGDGITNPWDLAHRLLGGAAGPGPLAALAAGDAGPRLLALEPDVARPDPDLERAAERRKQDRKTCRSTSVGREATICLEPSPHWPAPDDPAWHLSDAYSQLASARREVEAALAPGAPRVRVVHLDTGYDGDHVALPPHLERAASLDFTAGDPPRPPGEDPAADCFGCNPGHGTGTLSILAGGEMTLTGVDGRALAPAPLGGAPFAEVREFRVSPSVIHLTTGRMVRAFDLARREQADVLSMSMGGLPSEALADAVDAAYDAGVAMFTAAGDFLQPPLLPVRSPKSIVYPARFRRVIAVTGATADRKTYARAASAFSWLRGKVGSWALRGSYGPLSAMDHALAGYTPNVPWAVLSRVPPSNLVDLDGAGTSASTPQVAAAAALWLERHRAGFGDADWRSWKKTEAVYRALLAAADAGPAGDARARRYYRTYFGAGLLRARDALARAPGLATLEPRPPSALGLDWLELVTSVGPFAGEGDASRSLRAGMLRTEAAQLVASSVELQQLLGERELDQAPPPELRRRFLAALAREPGASEALRAALAALAAKR